MGVSPVRVRSNGRNPDTASNPGPVSRLVRGISSMQCPISSIRRDISSIRRGISSMFCRAASMQRCPEAMKRAVEAQHLRVDRRRGQRAGIAALPSLAGAGEDNAFPLLRSSPQGAAASNQPCLPLHQGRLASSRPCLPLYQVGAASNQSYPPLYQGGAASSRPGGVPGVGGGLRSGDAVHTGANGHHPAPPRRVGLPGGRSPDPLRPSLRRATSPARHGGGEDGSPPARGWCPGPGLVVCLDRTYALPCPSPSR